MTEPARELARRRRDRRRAFYATPERLGEYVLVDYVSRRSRSI